MQALSMAHCIGRPEQAVPVYRLVTKATMEERVHQLVDRKKGSELVFKSSVRWGYLLYAAPAHRGTCSIAASALWWHLLYHSTCPVEAPHGCSTVPVVWPNTVT